MDGKLIGKSQSVKQIKAQVEIVANGQLNAVICGETGVGKDLLVQMIYNKSKAKGKPFVKVNCGAIAEDASEQEFMKSVENILDRYDQQKLGNDEPVSGLVLFFDEMDRVSRSLQGKIFQLLQNKEFVTKESDGKGKNDIWVIIASRKPVSAWKGIMQIDIPPLRRRSEDVLQLVSYYLGKYTSVSGKKHTLNNMDDRIIKKLTTYAWPGNIKELQDLLRGVLVSKDWSCAVKGFKAQPDLA